MKKVKNSQNININKLAKSQINILLNKHIKELNQEKSNDTKKK